MNNKLFHLALLALLVLGSSPSQASLCDAPSEAAQIALKKSAEVLPNQKLRVVQLREAQFDEFRSTFEVIVKPAWAKSYTRVGVLMNTSTCRIRAVTNRFYSLNDRRNGQIPIEEWYPRN
jgi:hypothetical protein